MCSAQKLNVNDVKLSKHFPKTNKISRYSQVLASDDLVTFESTLIAFN